MESTNPNTANADVTNVTDDQSQETDTQSKAASPERLLTEAKKMKERAQKAEAKLKEIEEEKLKAQGREKERADLWESKYKELNSKLLKERVDSAIKGFAKDSGAIDPDAVIRLGDMEKVFYDEETGEVSGVSEMIEELKAKKSYLFKQDKKPAINPFVPGAKAQAMDSDKFKNSAKLATADRNKLLAEVLAKKR